MIKNNEYVKHSNWSTYFFSPVCSVDLCILDCHHDRMSQKEVMLPASNHFVEHHVLLDLYPNCLQWNFPPKAQNWNNNQQNQQRGGCHHEASLFTFLINWVWESAREVTSHQLEGGTPKRITREVGERGTDIACRCILLIFLLIPPMDLHPLLSLASGKVFLHGFTGLT